MIARGIKATGNIAAVSRASFRFCFRVHALTVIINPIRLLLKQSFEKSLLAGVSVSQKAH